MICAIHQPNFFPWLGYFNKMARADVFVFLNQVDYEKSGHSMQCYTNRVGILSRGKREWVHCPVIREHGPQKICGVKINNDLPWRENLKILLTKCYQESAYFTEVHRTILKLIDIEKETISEYNIAVISELRRLLEIPARIVTQDDLESKEHSTRLLVDIVRDVKCNQYLCGKGSEKYQEDEMFGKYNIELIKQNYVPPMYAQMTKEHVAGLSIIDVLYNCGFEETKKIIRI